MKPAIPKEIKKVSETLHLTPKKRNSVLTEQGIPDNLSSSNFTDQDSIFALEGSPGANSGGNRQDLMWFYRTLSTDTFSALRFNRKTGTISMSYTLESKFVKEVVLRWLRKSRMRRGRHRSTPRPFKRILASFHATSRKQLKSVVETAGNQTRSTSPFVRVRYLPRTAWEGLVEGVQAARHLNILRPAPGRRNQSLASFVVDPWSPQVKKAALLESLLAEDRAAAAQVAHRTKPEMAAHLEVLRLTSGSLIGVQELRYIQLGRQNAFSIDIGAPRDGKVKGRKSVCSVRVQFSVRTLSAFSKYDMAANIAEIGWKNASDVNVTERMCDAVAALASAAAV